jgi:hypothetical protein
MLALPALQCIVAMHAAAQPAALTPVGAEQSASADTLVPAWTGGETLPPAGWQPRQVRVNPWQREAALFTVNSANLDQYAGRLSPGQAQLVRSLAGYRMDVYPSRRSCGYPETYYQRTKAARGVAKLAADGWTLVDAPAAAVPFPAPKSGAEVIWNHKLRYQGHGLAWSYHTVMPSKNGSLGEPLASDELILWPMADPKTGDLKGARSVEAYFLNVGTAPAQAAGDAVLAHAFVDRPNDIWLYFAGQRRVRRAPTYGYDAPILGLENLMNVDSFLMFNGPMDRYDFKLLGKREMIAPYNWMALANPPAKLSDVVQPAYLNRDLVRYEHHRLWVVEATLKPGLRHTFPKRTFFVDEDTWGIVVEDLYDAQGKLQRVMESGPFVAHEIGSCVWQAMVSHDLVAGRYVADRLPMGKSGSDWAAGRDGRVTSSSFEPDALRRSGARKDEPSRPAPPRPAPNPMPLEPPCIPCQPNPPPGLHPLPHG